MAKLKSYEDRIIDDKAREDTLGIPAEGFYDPTGEFPLNDYKSETSINKAARGNAINEIQIGGGDTEGAVEIPTTIASIYPFNQVKETASGHVIEYDDTPGNERILIKHRTGAGVECRPDGSFIISSIKNKVEVVGGSSTVIVEGNGDLVYKGNLNLTVSGDLNMNVGGDYNLNVAGKKSETIMHSSTTLIIQDEVVTVKGNSTKDIELEDTLRIRGSQHYFIDSDRNLKVGNNSTSIIKEEYNVMSRTVDQSFTDGVIGGSNVDLTANTATITTTYGTLEGKADFAAKADEAGSAPPGAGSGGGTQTKVTVEYTPFVDSDEARTVDQDTLNTAYYSITNHVPDTEYARSKLRTSSNASDTTFTDALIEAGIISSQFNSTSVPGTGRRVSTTPAFKGETPIGSNPPTIDVKSIQI